METLMAAARELRTYEEIVFLFIGEGQKKNWMKNYVREWRLTNCRFHTYVKREELNLSLACADVGVVTLLPSQEGLSEPSKTLGIMAAGIPVIGVLPGGSESARILREYSCGQVVESGDVEGLTASILMLYHHPELRLAWGRNARKAVKDAYSLDHAARSYVSVIESLQNGGTENEPDESRFQT
jgi:glycosyltransferase involved in cell wall biosynthesis